MEFQNIGNDIYQSHLQGIFYITRPVYTESLNRHPSIRCQTASTINTQILSQPVQSRKSRANPQATQLYRMIKHQLPLSHSVCLKPNRHKNSINVKCDKIMSNMQEWNQKVQGQGKEGVFKRKNKKRVGSNQECIFKHSLQPSNGQLHQFSQQKPPQPNTKTIHSQAQTHSLHLFKQQQRTLHLFKHYQQLRQTNAGLILPASLIEKSTHERLITKAEDKKAKTDILYQKSLTKNCDAILLDIESYKKGSKERKMKKVLKSKMKVKHVNFEIMNKQTQSSKNKLNLKYLPSQYDDLDSLQWKEKYLSLQMQCINNYQSNKDVREGLRVMQKFSKKMGRRMKAYDKKIQKVMNNSWQQKGAIYDENFPQLRDDN